MDLPGLLKNWLGLSTDPQQQAAITGLFQMLGLLLTGSAALISLISGWALTRWRDSRRRKQDRRDVRVALQADVRAAVSHFRGIDLEALRQVGNDRIREGAEDTPPYTPFVPQVSESRIWQAVSADVAILPEAVITPVLLYYDQRDALQLFVNDLRGEEFAALAAGRKVAMFNDYVEMQRKLAYYAERAYEALSESLIDEDQ